MDLICRKCLRRVEEGDGCEVCEGEDVVDLSSDTERREFAEALRGRAAKRRRRFVLVMEGLAILFCAGVLFVGTTIARGLGGGAVEWGAKLFAVVVLAVCWKAIPVIYGRHLEGEAAAMAAEFGVAKGSDDVG